MPITSFSGETRRRVPYVSQAGACSLKVPVYAESEGDWLEGRFNVPARLAYTAAHTNDRLEFERVVRANFERWTGWRRSRGWEVVPGTLKLDGPQDVPVERSGDEGEEDMRLYVFLAKFKRTTPLYVGLDDVLELRDMAERYGVKPNGMPWNDASGAEDTGWVNPLEHAEQRRQALGLKRKDYLLGPIDEPL